MEIFFERGSSPLLSFVERQIGSLTVNCVITCGCLSLEDVWQVYFSHLETGDRLQHHGLQTELYYFEVNVWSGVLKSTKAPYFVL